MDKLQDLGFLLNEAGRLFTRRFEERARPLSLQLAHCKALILLAENEDISQARLAEISEIDPARLVGILDRLEADGWVRRRRRPDDRRVRSLAVTENVAPILRLIWGLIGETYVEALQGLSADDLGSLIQALARVHSNLSACKPLGADPLGAAGDIAAGGRLRLVR
ncbi:MAG TPA: MarR family transcriptional regulator [Xanthobacteraceae bacterium]|jgi:DNA-binding MarR family transcriptional regulator